MALGGVGTSATQRIVDLSKRNRELSAEVASERNRVRQLHKKMKEIERARVKDESSKKEGTHSTPSRKNDSLPQRDELSTVIAQHQEQLKHAQQKMTEHRNQCQVLKQELKLAQKVIAKEVGEGVSMSALLSGVSGWRGRAQQISTLQNKVAELKEQLEHFRTSTSHGSKVTGSRGDFSSSFQADSRQKAALQRLEKERRATMEETRLELETLQSEYTKLQQKYGALKARNKILTEDVKQMKSQPSLMERQRVQQGPDHARTSSVASSCETGSPGRQGWRREKQMLLEANNSLQEHLKRCLVELQSLKRDQHTPKVKAKSSKAPISLPPVVPPPSSRRDQRPNAATCTHLERKSVSAGHTMVATSSKHHVHSDSIEASALSQVTQIERDRLMELTGSLQQRLDATTDKLIRLETELRNQKQHSIHLEKRLGRLHSTTGEKSAGGHKEDVSELQMRLEIQMDENAVLKETLELTRHEKMEDMKLYRKMLQETKKLFIDRVRKMQSKTSA